jgi:hypothetical protein
MEILDDSLQRVKITFNGKRKADDRAMIGAKITLETINIVKSPYPKEAYMGDWIVESVSRNGKTVIARRALPED